MTIPVHFSGKTFSLNSNNILAQADTLFINEYGDTMKGDLNMNGNKIIATHVPENNNEVINKGYLDQAIKYLDIEVLNTKSSLTNLQLELSKMKEKYLNDIKTNFTNMELEIKKDIEKCKLDLQNKSTGIRDLIISYRQYTEDTFVKQEKTY